MPLIEMTDVTRTFKVHSKVGRFRRETRMIPAVSGLTFSIEPGEFVGYLGANGAGKSTTIKMLTGILIPTRGRVVIDGRDPFRDRSVAYELGAMFGQRVQLWWDLPLVESFEQLRYIYRVADKEYVRRQAELVEILDLGDLLNKPVRQLSLGQRIRGELAASMMHGPRVLFLDEPTIGLDVMTKQRVREFLTTINRERGVTILLTTHDMGDLERMCSRLILLVEGRLVGDGPVQSLFDEHDLERTVTVDLVEQRAPLVVPGARVVAVDGPRQILKFSARNVSAAALVAMILEQAQLSDLKIEEPSVEDLVRALPTKSDRKPEDIGSTR